MSIRETLSQAGYISIHQIDEDSYILIDENYNQEMWVSNPGHASYGIVLENGTELEFVRNLS